MRPKPLLRSNFPFTLYSPAPRSGNFCPPFTASPRAAEKDLTNIPVSVMIIQVMIIILRGD